MAAEVNSDECRVIPGRVEDVNVSNALTVTNNMDVMTLGKILVDSKFFADSRDAAQAVVKILAGQELGFGPIASMTGIYIVKNKVSLSANLMAAAIKRTGKYNYRVLTLNDDECSLAFLENGEQVGISSFTMKDAKKAVLASGDNWTKFPRNMLFARALSNGAKWYCPDIFGGPVYTPDELGATVDGETGEVIEGSFNTTTGEIVPPARQGHQDAPGRTPAPQQVETPTPPASAPLGANRARSEFDPPVESMAREMPETVDDPPAPVWPNDDARWIKLVETARTQLWNNLVIKHAQNRVAKALGLPSWDARHTYTGSDKDAWNACKAYVPSDQQPPAKRDPDKAYACTGCGKDTFRTNIDGYPQCNDCAKLRDKKQFAIEEEIPI